jgi:hypothetical protein
MIVRLDLLTRDAIIARAGCPTCGATRGRPCHSRFLHKPMINQVHLERRSLAAGVAPADR